MASIHSNPADIGRLSAPTGQNLRARIIVGCRREVAERISLLISVFDIHVHIEC